VISKRQPSLYLLAFFIPQQLSKRFRAYQAFSSLRCSPPWNNRASANRCRICVSLRMNTAHPFARSPTADDRQGMPMSPVMNERRAIDYSTPWFPALAETML
jgi:hypothetical protein